MRLRRHLRRRATDLFGASFELLIALAAIVTAVSYFANPALLADAAVGDQAGPLAIAWSALYGAAGVAIFYGLIRPALRFELAGLSLLAAAALVNAVAIYVLRGPSGLGSILTYLALVPACGMRGFLVWRLHELLSGWPGDDRRSHRRTPS